MGIYIAEKPDEKCVCLKGNKYSFHFIEMMLGIDRISLDILQKSKVWREIHPKERERLTNLLSKPPYKK